MAAFGFCTLRTGYRLADRKSKGSPIKEKESRRNIYQLLLKPVKQTGDVAVRLSFALNATHGLANGGISHPARPLSKFSLRQATVAAAQPKCHIPSRIVMPVPKTFPRFAFFSCDGLDHPLER
jgi:hypothetical protein